MTYTTKDGDTWDAIAYSVYGDDHAYEGIIDANAEYIDVLVFDYGVELTIPDEAEDAVEVSSDYPAWRTAVDNDAG